MFKLRRSIEQLAEAKYDASQAAAPLRTISETASQKEIRQLTKKEREALGGKAGIFARLVSRRESWQKSVGQERVMTTDEFAIDANAVVVVSRVEAVTRRMAEESRKGGRPKQRQRRFGFLLRRNRGN